MKRFHSLPVLAILVLEILLPARWFPASGLLEAGLAGWIAALLYRDLAGAGWRRPGLLLWIGLLGGLAINGILALQTHRAVLAGCRFFLYAVVYLCARHRGAGRRGEDLLRALAVLGGLAAAWGILQVTGGFREALAILETVDLPSEDLLAARLRSGRVFGPFILPSTFGSFLILTIPVTAGLLFRRAPIPERVGWAGILAAEVWALYATRSHGAVLALLAALVTTAFLRFPPRFRRRILMAAAVLLVVLVAVVQSRERVILDPDDPTGPIGQRFGVWRAAAGMIADRPLFGVGADCFGIAFPRYRAAGIHDTWYAHNSYLQLPAEYGIWVALPVLMFLAAHLRRIRGRPGESGPDWRRVLCGIGGSAFLIHNLVDFSLLVPATGLPFLALMGWMDRREGVPAPATAPAAPVLSACLRGGAVAGALANLLLAGLLFVSDRHLAAAREFQRRENLPAAVAALEKAVAAYPIRPEGWGQLAAVLYGSVPADRATLERAREMARRAVEADPHTAHRFELLGAIDFALGNDAPAYLELRRATRLHPGQQRYVEALERVRERIGQANEPRP